MSQPIPKCIECGGPVNSLNEDEDGVPCAACAERLLETLPGVFHSPWGGAETVAVAGTEDTEPAAEDESAPAEQHDRS